MCVLPPSCRGRTKFISDFGHLGRGKRNFQFPEGNLDKGGGQGWIMNFSGNAIQALIIHRISGQWKGHSVHDSVNHAPERVILATERVNLDTGGVSLASPRFFLLFERVNEKLPCQGGRQGWGSGDIFDLRGNDFSREGDVNCLGHSVWGRGSDILLSILSALQYYCQGSDVA